MALQGRTDTSITRDILAFLGVEATPEEEKRFRAAYLALLPITLPAGKSKLHPGICEALDAVHAHPEIHQGLLTGNIEEGAKLKLSHLGIWHYFEFGAYADDSHIRDELGPFALARAKQKLGIDFPPERVFIIGDTPHDVACGKAIGAKTIAVATGSFRRGGIGSLQSDVHVCGFVGYGGGTEGHPVTLHEETLAGSSFHSSGYDQGDRCAAGMSPTSLRHVDFLDYSALTTKPSLPNKIFYLLTGQGHHAVMIFFVLSGFFVAGSVATDYENETWSWRRFAIRRLTRLYVVLIPALLLTQFWDSWGKNLVPSGWFGQHSLFLFSSNVLYFQRIFTEPYGTNSPLWSVAYEFWYYLMFPLVFSALAFRTRKGERLLCLALLITCIAILPQKVLIGGLVWLTGYGAFTLFHRKTSSSYSSSGAVFSLGLLGLVLSGCTGSTTQGITPSDVTVISPQDILTGFCFSLMVPYLAKNQPGVAWYRAVAIGLSDISYTLYAVHFPVVVFLGYTIIRSKDAVPSVTSYAHFIGYLVFILVYATVVWWLFESRTGKVRKFLEGRLLRSRTVVSHQ